MKTKISFTSVLKSKTGPNKFNISSQQHISESQNKSRRLIDIYEQYQSYPDQQYTLNLNGVRHFGHRSRNGSIKLIKSKNMNEDPQVDLESWIQSQKLKQNLGSVSRSRFSNSSRLSLNKQACNQSVKNYSNFNKNYQSREQQIEDDQKHPYNLQNSKQSSYNKRESINNVQIQKISKGNSQKDKKNQNQYQQQKGKNVIKYQQNSNIDNYNNVIKKQTQNYQAQAIQSYFADQQFRSRKDYPLLQDQQYLALKEDFQKIKNQRVAQICSRTSNLNNKQKLEQILNNALQNIYAEIQEKAENMKNQKINQQRLIDQCTYNKNNSHLNYQPEEDEQSEEMLIENSKMYPDYKQNQKSMQSFQQEHNQSEEKRQLQMKNKIKDYICGIQEAKSQSNKNYSINYSNNEPSFNESKKVYNNNEPSFNESKQMYEYNQPTFSDYNSKVSQDAQYERGSQVYQKGSQISAESVGYSFSNNLVCEHSFNKDIAGVSTNDYGFQKYQIQPPIYEPQNQDEEQQHKFLADIHEVKSDCGDFPQNHDEVESSQQIEFRRKRIDNHPAIQIIANNIQNIQSVHYQPHQNTTFGTLDHNNGFKSYAEPSFLGYQQQKPYMQDKIYSQTFLYKQPPKFISKTFNSYLNGEKKYEQKQKQKNSLSKNINSQSIKTNQKNIKFDSVKQTKIAQLQKNDHVNSKSSSKDYAEFTGSNKINEQLKFSKQSKKDLDNSSNISSPMMKIQELKRNQQQRNNEIGKITRFNQLNNNNFNSLQATYNMRNEILEMKPIQIQSIDINSSKLLKNIQLSKLNDSKMVKSSLSSYDKNNFQKSNQNQLKQINIRKQDFHNISNNQGHQNRNSHKILTKITLKNGSFQKPKIPLQKIISLNQYQQKSQANIYSQNGKDNHITAYTNETDKNNEINTNDCKDYKDNQKQNIFNRLQIKQSMSINQSLFLKEQKQINKLNDLQKNEIEFNKNSTKIINYFNPTISNLHIDKTDNSLKENNNTLNKINNGSIHTAGDYIKTQKPSDKRDWKNDSMKFDLNSETNKLNDSISNNAKNNLLNQRKQPLLKLSKNLGTSTMQQSLSNKMSIGQSIKGRIHSSNLAMGSSRGMKQSFKKSVKQSIGNESDMDFDLGLD